MQARVSSVLISLSLVTALAMLGGCNKSSKSTSGKSTTTESGATVKGLKVIDDSGFPELTIELPIALDDGRVKIQGPDGWVLASRSRSYLARFAKKGVDLPRILITAEDSPLESPTELTAENLDDFAAKMADHYVKSKTKLIESVRPMHIQGKPCIRFVKGAKLKGVSVEQQVLVTVFDKRLYQVSLDVNKGEITEHKNAGYAVFAGLSFVTPEKAAPADAEKADGDKEEPAEKQPAE